MAVSVTIVAGAVRHLPDEWCFRCHRATVFEYHVYGLVNDDPTTAGKPVGTWRGCGFCDVGDTS